MTPEDGDFEAQKHDEPEPTADATEGVTKGPVAPELSPEERAEAVTRVAASFRELAKAPEGVLQMLARLEIPVHVVIGEAFHSDVWLRLPDTWRLDEEFIVMRMRDVEAGEERNQAKGSLLQQITRGERKLSGFGGNSNAGVMDDPNVRPDIGSGSDNLDDMGKNEE